MNLWGGHMAILYSLLLYIFKFLIINTFKNTTLKKNNIFKSKRIRKEKKAPPLPLNYMKTNFVLLLKNIQGYWKMLILCQGLANPFSKGLYSKYFRLCRIIVSALTTQFYYWARKTAIDNTCSCVLIKFYYEHWIWIDIIFKHHKMCLIFFNSLKM